MSLLESEFQKAIDAAILARPDMNGREYRLRMSSAGECPRLLDYKVRHGTRTEDLQSAMRLLTGEPIHEFYRRVFTDAFGDNYKMVESEVAISIEGETITGHCDGVLRTGEHLALVEIKTVGFTTYDMVVKNAAPLPQHLEQANMYACVIGATKVYVLYHNRNDGRYTVFSSDANLELFEATKEKFAGVIRRRGGEMIRRPFNDATQAPCSYCEFRDDCYQGFKETVRAFDRETFIDAQIEPNIYSACDSILSNRTMRLDADKQEKAAKAELAAWMLKNDTKSVLTHRARYSISIGKNNNPLIEVEEVKNE